jgi:multisubunit Na+/H+ antiporter MnhG subunit
MDWVGLEWISVVWVIIGGIIWLAMAIKGLVKNPDFATTVIAFILLGFYISLGPLGIFLFFCSDKHKEKFKDFIP